MHKSMRKKLQLSFRCRDIPKETVRQLTATRSAKFLRKVMKLISTCITKKRSKFTNLKRMQPWRSEHREAESNRCFRPHRCFHHNAHKNRSWLKRVTWKRCWRWEAGCAQQYRLTSRKALTLITARNQQQRPWIKREKLLQRVFKIDNEMIESHPPCGFMPEKVWRNILTA